MFHILLYDASYLPLNLYLCTFTSYPQYLHIIMYLDMYGTNNLNSE